MQIKTYTYTNKGSRSNNEDYCGYYSYDDYGVWVLADGLGGHDCGEVASEMATNFILDSSKEINDFSEENLIMIMNKANEIIMKEQNANIAHRNMKTTVVAGFLKDGVFRYFNVGDSRLYYFKNGCLYAQTKDHTVSQIVADLGEIPTAGIRFHDDRNKLLKVLGNENNLNIKKLDSPIKVESGNAFLLCSDGFWEYVYETEMEIDLVKSSTPRQWLEFMVKRLLLRVTGNNDNFTAICVFID